LGASDWVLTIVNSSIGDSGLYECQVNTDPKMHNQFHLSVTEGGGEEAQDGRHQVPVMEVGRSGKHRTLSKEGRATINILGGNIHYVSQGGEVSLECEVSNLARPPHALNWQRGGQPVSAKERPGLSLETERLAGTSRARLYLAQSEVSDSGNYTCVCDQNLKQTVRLVVTLGFETPPKGLKGYRGASDTLLPSKSLPILLLLLLQASSPLLQSFHSRSLRPPR